jgi:transcriptional regulator with XRE-family HTH domain
MNGRKLVAWNLRRLRVGQRLSQEKLAADAGVDRAYMSRLERELENPTVGLLDRIAKALSAHISEFFVEPKAGESAHFDECGQGIRLIADVSPREAGQQSDDAGQCLPSTMVMRSGLCRCVKWGAFGGGFAQALACEGEAMGVVHEPVEDGVGNGWIGDHVVPMLHIDLAGDDG